MSAPELSVVVPVYNNAATLEELLNRIVHVLDERGTEFEIVLVDDGSSDRTAEIVSRRAAADPRIRSYALTRNFGSQAAICAGFDLVRGRRTVCLDADLENYPEDIPLLLDALDRGHDLACGVREERSDSLLQRRLPSALLNAYVRHRIGTTVRDIGCGLRAMDSRVIHNLASEGEGRRLVTPLMLKRARSVVEVPIRHRPKSEPGGHSFLTLLGIALDFYMLSARRPFLIGGIASLFMAVTGSLLLVVAWITAAPRLAIGALVLLAGGFVGGLLSLVGEYAQRIYQLDQGIPFYELKEDKEDAR
jgi:glycosyltransferase involved in cell wall biosynthesis